MITGLAGRSSAEDWSRWKLVVATGSKEESMGRVRVA